MYSQVKEQKSKGLGKVKLCFMSLNIDGILFAEASDNFTFKS